MEPRASAWGSATSGFSAFHQRTTSGVRRFYLLAQVLLATGTWLPAGILAWLSSSVPLGLAVALAQGLATWRMARRVMRDPPRPRWVVRGVDEPLFWLWGAGFFGLLCWLVLALLLVPWALATEQALGLVLGKAALGTYALGLLASGWAVWPRRRWVVVRHVDVPVVGLAPEWDGYRLAHLSDLHVGGFDDLRRARDWVRQTNRLGADVIVVTGDLVTSGVAHYDAAATALGELRAPDGVFVVMGNHDQWDNPSFVRRLRERGLRVLLNETVVLERGGARLNLSGVDDPYSGKSDLRAALLGRAPGAASVLLAHYPHFFEPARAAGVDLVLSGHTHGGQVALPFFAERYSLANWTGQRNRGVYRAGRTTLYVNAGLGTTGPPLRVGVPPEIALLTLRAAPPAAEPGLVG